MNALTHALRTTRRLLQKRTVQVMLIVLLALILRLGHVLLNERWPSIWGGDYSWYAEYGKTLVTTGWTFGPPPTGPIFLLVAGYAEQLSPPAFASGQPAWLLQRMLAGEIIFLNPVGSGQMLIRLLHALVGALTVLMLYRIGRAAWSHTAGLMTAAAVAINPIFILEAGNLATESITLFLALWALALWMERIEVPGWRLMAAAGSLLALAALTRSVFLAFPLIPLTHLWIRFGVRRALRWGSILLLAFFLTISPWTLYNLVQWNRLTLTGEGLLGMLYVGATGWKAPQQVDAELGFEGTGAEGSDYAARQNAFTRGFLDTVLSNPAGYAARRLGELGSALLQPHNTTFYPGASIKALALDWLRHDRSPGGLLALTQVESFWQKLLLYVFHYVALLVGAAGLILNRRRWRDLWPLYAPFGYFLGIHLVLSAIPRYLFPLEPFLWLFAGAALTAYAAASHRHDQRVMESSSVKTVQ